VKYLILILISSVFLLCSCKGPAGQTGPSGLEGPTGVEALTDSTIKPEVIWTYPVNNQIGPLIDFQNGISIRLNKLIDYTTINQSIQISPKSGYARIDTGNVRLSGDEFFAGLVSDSSYLWSIGQKYTVTVSTILKDVNGNSLQSPYSFSFSPEPYFRVTAVYPPNGTRNFYRTDNILIDFNNSIDFQSFHSAISISPAVAGTWQYEAGFNGYFAPSSQYDSSTVYTVTLGTGCRDAPGRPLSKPYTFSFTTGLN
jgi:Bacterial Ig-like domain